MVMSEETLSTGAPDRCPDCGKEIELSVCQSAAGFYIGAWCYCGPYCRESGYFPTKEAANAAWKGDK